MRAWNAAAMFVLVSASLVRAAGLEFAELRKETRAAIDAKSVIVDFPFINKNGRPVTITKSDAKCSCLTVQISGGKFTYAPGESGVIRTTMALGNLLGPQEKTIDLWLDQAPPDKPSMRLDLVVQIPNVISLEPKTVHWDIGGKPEPRTIHIVMDGGKPIHVTNVTVPEESFRYELKTLEAGKRYDLVVTPLDTKSPLLGRIQVETDCSISKYKNQQAFAQVRKPVAENVANQP
ncbi:hypothetical protein GCM10023212_26460 [Luteolibacter yonseiensis]